MRIPGPAERALFAEQSGALYRLSESSSAHCVIAWGAEAHLLSQSLQKHDCWALRRGELHEVGIADASIRCHHYNGTGDGHQLCVPIMTQHGPIGLLTLHAPLDNDAATRIDAARNRSILRGIADRLGPALSSIELRTRLQEDSIRDPLTKLYNRRFLAESLQRELLRTSRARQHLSLIMLDLDNFKAVNDDYGHDVGDQVLVLLAQQLHQAFRKEDFIYRYGGDEFLVIMPGAGLDVARQRVLEACGATRALHIDTEKGPLHVTFSAGVATAPDHGTTEEALIACADEALYAAKEAGRDGVKLAAARR
jgi:diguanylate cyclase (GGDEF)-like protein